MNNIPVAPLPTTLSELRRDIIGIDTRVPVLDGSLRPYVFLDNGASTPSFGRVLRCVESFLPWYSGVHRGTGFKSLLSTEVYDAAHAVVGRFVGADPSYHTVVFTRNTTECVNKLANRAELKRDDVVITTLLEHHSNDLPWRKYATVVHVGMLPDGRLDVDAMRDAIKRHAGKLRFVAVTGASNITGYCSPIHDIAEWAHAAGARIFVDAAQLAPHRRISMEAPDDPRNLDFVALSAHKMYAPFGTGALVGPTSFFEQGDPDMVGGGVVEVVTLDHAHWNKPPHKEEAGSPNVVGAVALGEAVAILESVGMDAVAEHESALLQYAYRHLSRIPGVHLYGLPHPPTDKVGVITYNIRDMHHALVAAIMGIEGAIGIRNGCFCAHPYVKELLGLTAEDDAAHEAAVLGGDKTSMPGLIRASLGCYNSTDDIDALVEMTGRITRGEYQGVYVQERASGAYQAQGASMASGDAFPYLKDFFHHTKVSA